MRLEWSAPNDKDIRDFSIEVQVNASLSTPLLHTVRTNISIEANAFQFLKNKSDRQLGDLFIVVARHRDGTESSPLPYRLTFPQGHAVSFISV